MRIPFILVALALAAGCVSIAVDPASVSGATSQPIHALDSAILERVTTNARDDTLLDMAVWRPDTTDKVPVIVDIGPYFGIGGNIMEFAAIDLRLAEYFVPRGYAVARASVRGTGESEGCFDLGGPTERRDVADMVQFLGDAEWSNGNVAAFGKSYDGTTPWMAAIEKPPALKTVVPISGITDWYRYMFYDGVSYPEELAFNTYYYLYVDDEISVPGPDGGDPAIHNPDPGHIVTKNVLRTCDGLVPQTIPQTQSTLTGDHDLPFWIERDYERLGSEIEVPVFMVHGLQDWNVKPDNQLPMFAALTGPKVLWAGQWAHDYPDINRFNADWSRHDWNETLLVWFDHWLKGVDDNGWEELLHVEIQDQTGAWRTWATWPPAVNVHELHLGATGALAPAPTEVGRAAFGGPLAVALTFASPPLAQDIRFSGAPTLDLTLAADRPLGFVAVKLFDESPDGTRLEVDHGARDMRHRGGRGSGSVVPVGTAFEMNVTLYPQEIFISRGHRIVLEVRANDPDWWVESLGVRPEFSIDLGESRTVLRLPVSDGEWAFAADPSAASSRSSLGVPTLETMK